MNKENCSLLPVLAIATFFISLWLFLTERISPFLFCILSAVSIGIGLGWLAGQEEKRDKWDAIQNAANLNFQTAETISFASQQLLAWSEGQARNLKRQILVVFITALIPFGPVLLKVIHHIVGH